MSAVTKYPVVMIHGIFGYGRDKPLWNLGSPYWPEAVLDAINPNYILLDVGKVTSDHDRACEAFYQLLGGTVDYGEAHARETNHARFGLTYAEGKHPKWGEANPIHLVGHSMGSTTAIELYQLVCQDAFGVGSNHKWVRSITCIAGPLTGALISHAVGLHDLELRKWTLAHILTVSLGVWFKIYKAIPCLRGFFDLGVDQWSHCSLGDVISVKGRVNKSLDMAMYTCLPAIRIQRNSQLRHMEKVYLLSITTSPRAFHLPRRELGMLAIIGFLAAGRFPRWWPYLLRFRGIRALLAAWTLVMLWRRVRRWDYAKLPNLDPLRWFMRKRARSLHKIYEGFDPEIWHHNDGIVSIHSMLRPWFPKPQELAASRSTQSLTQFNEAVGTGSIRPSPSTASLRSSSSASSLANAAMLRCASHISIDGFHRDLLEEENAAALAAAAAAAQPKRFEKGRWYVYRVDCNHFAGTYGDANAADLYKSLFTMMIDEYEREDAVLHVDTAPAPVPLLPLTACETPPPTTTSTSTTAAPEPLKPMVRPVIASPPMLQLMTAGTTASA